MASVLAPARAPWWIIGSAAAALHGVATPVRDVDVLLAPEDAAALLPGLGAELVSGSTDGLFRSRFYARWREAPLVVEFMAALEVRGDPLAILTRQAVRVGDATLFVPARDELAAIMRRFGRLKDLARAAALALSPSAPRAAP